MNSSLKSQFPFRLSVPSFVYPADYATNVKLLGPFVDEIELLFFESAEQSLPTATQIQELSGLAARLDLFYNVHLPLDLDLGSENDLQRRHAVERLTQIIQLSAPLRPTTHTLHLQFNDKNSCQLDTWRTRTLASLEILLRKTNLPPRAISVETLDYPPEWMAPVVNRLNLSVCVDVGHLIINGFDLLQTLQQFGNRTNIIHLHGVSGGKDHRGLDQLQPAILEFMRGFLSHYCGTLSLEIFSLIPLQNSLRILSEMLASTLEKNKS